MSTMRRITHGDCECYVFETSLLRTVVVVAVTGRKGQIRVLSSIRQLINNPISASELIDSATRQSVNLSRKLAVLDCLRLSGLLFSSIFCTARVHIGSESDQVSRRALGFATECITELQQELGAHFIVQPDYDQKLYHQLHGSSFDNLELKSAHLPSAVGTITCFEEILKHCGVPLALASVALIGVGELGSRLVDLLLQRNVKHLSLYDIDKNKTARFEHVDHILVANGIEQACTGVDAVVFAAHSGSLTPMVADLLARSRDVLVVGGPEAGLDHNKEAIEALTSARKHFAPSLFCGCVGLAANLEELVAGEWDLDRLTNRLLAEVARIMNSASREGLLFQQEAEKQVRAWLAGIEHGEVNE